MKPLQTVHAGLERGRQCFISRGPVGEQCLPLTLRDRNDREEERYIRRRTAIALIGMPTAAMREPRRQLAILGQRRLGPARWLTSNGWRVRHAEDLGHGFVQHVQWRKGMPVILDFRTKNTTEPHETVPEIFVVSN